MDTQVLTLATEPAAGSKGASELLSARVPHVLPAPGSPGSFRRSPESLIPGCTDIGQELSNRLKPCKGKSLVGIGRGNLCFPGFHQNSMGTTVIGVTRDHCLFSH